MLPRPIANASGPTDPNWQSAIEEVRELKSRVNDLFVKFTELKDRELFHTFHPYLWEVQEEVTHLVTYMDWLDTGPAVDEIFPGEAKIHNFYRRGIGARIQEILKRDEQDRYHHDG